MFKNVNFICRSCLLFAYHECVLVLPLVTLNIIIINVKAQCIIYINQNLIHKSKNCKHWTWTLHCMSLNNSVCVWSEVTFTLVSYSLWSMVFWSCSIFWSDEDVCWRIMWSIRSTYRENIIVPKWIPEAHCRVIWASEDGAEQQKKSPKLNWFSHSSCWPFEKNVTTDCI